MTAHRPRDGRGRHHGGNQPTELIAVGWITLTVFSWLEYCETD